MSTLSDAFHSFLRAVKADLADAWDSVVGIFDKAVADTMPALEADIKAAGPVVFQIVSNAVLALAASGSSPVGPAITAALGALGKEGIVVAEHVVHGIVASVVANLKTDSIPTSGGPIS